MSAKNGLVQRLWSYCNVLRDDGLSYGDYLEHLTYLLFLKMADEQTKPPFSRPAVVPEGLDWPSLLVRPRELADARRRREGRCVRGAAREERGGRQVRRRPVLHPATADPRSRSSRLLRSRSAVTRARKRERPSAAEETFEAVEPADVAPSLVRVASTSARSPSGVPLQRGFVRRGRGRTARACSAG